MRYLALAVLLVALALAGCVPAPVNPEPADPPTATAPVPGITVTDSLGRTVTLAGPAERVVSLAPSLTEVLFAVGAGDRVVGVSSYCNYPPEAQERAQVGAYAAQSISIESIVALEPDLVLADGLAHGTVIEALEPLGVPVVALNPEAIDDVYADLVLVGDLTGYGDAARDVAGAMRARIDAVAEVATAIPAGERLVVYWQIWDEPLMTAGPATFVGQLIDLAGGVNAFGDVAEQYPQISAEEVVRRGPAVIMGPDTHGDKLTIEHFAERPGWAGIAAVRAGRVHLIDGDIVSRGGPRLADALEAVAQALYPERFR